MRISYEDNLKGHTVIDASGRAIGEVSTMVLDSESWKVDALRVKLRREIADEAGVPRGILRAGIVEVATSLVQGVGDTVLLRASVDTFRAGRAHTSQETRT